jgi:LmbE family N-acetylglucosaminyl deacetylase
VTGPGGRGGRSRAFVPGRPLAIPSRHPVPDLFSATRVLAIQPHYDDNDIAAGGTIAALIDAGIEVVYCTVTDDLVGVVDASLEPSAAAAALRGDQERAGAIIGVARQIRLGHPDAGPWDRFSVRADLLAAIREVRPDGILTADPFLPYEAHRDHTETGSVAAEAAILFGLPKLRSSRPEVDAAWEREGWPELRYVGFYYTATPNTLVDIDATWTRKAAAASEYHAQFEPEELPALVAALDARAQAVASLADGQVGCRRAEGLTVLHPGALHGGA